MGRPINEILTDVLNVKDYGALGDGATDDTAAIQAALDTHNPIRMPAGTYIVSDPLLLHNFMTLYGDGPGMTVIEFTGTGNCFANLSPGTRRYTCRFANFAVETTTGAKAFALDSCSSFVFENVTVTGWTVGWDIYGPTVSSYSAYNRFYNCNAVSCGTGYKLYGLVSNANEFVSCRVNSSVTYGLQIIDGNNNSWIGGQIETHQGTGIDLSCLVVGRADYNIISGVRLEGTILGDMPTGINIGTNVRGTLIEGIAIFSSVTTPLVDAGTRNVVIGGVGILPSLVISSAMTAAADGTGIPFSFTRTVHGGTATLGTNDPLLHLNDSITTASKYPTTLLISTAVSTGEFLRCRRASTDYAYLDATGNLTLVGGVQALGVARTATATGATTGTIAAGTSFVVVTSAGANNIIILPAPVVGNVIRLINGATGYELRSSTPASIGINGGVGADAESAIGANILVTCVCTTATNWVCSDTTAAGVITATEVAAT